MSGDAFTECFNVGDDADHSAFTPYFSESVKRSVQRVRVERAEALIKEERVYTCFAAGNLGEAKCERKADNESFTA